MHLEWWISWRLLEIDEEQSWLMLDGIWMEGPCFCQHCVSERVVHIFAVEVSFQFAD
jgi:hypothetical protein